MDLGIAGRVAIVGGSSQGMGKATAMALAREGARVALCARHGEALELTAREIGAATSEDLVLPVVADLSKSEEVDRLASETLQRWGRVDIVVNNVGGPPPGQPTEVSDAQWRAGFELNFSSAVRLCRQVLPSMRERGWGRIISILSLSIRQPEENLALSTVARTALAAYMKTLSTEVAREGITVNSVLPGSIETQRLQGVAEMQARFHGRDVAHAMEDRLALVAAGRFGRSEEVGDLICFLASERAGFITGQSIAIDGGQLRAMT